MRRHVLLLIPALLFLAADLAAQDTHIVARDNNRPNALYTQAMMEESVMLKPGGPCNVVALQIYFGGASPASDTIMIVGDAAEGAVPPTSWVWSYNLLAPAFVVEYDGTPGWKTYDISQYGIRSDGHDRIVIQHRLDPGGLSFVYDDSPQTQPYGSFIMNPLVNNSLGFPGQTYLANGDYMVRLLVAYDSVRGNGSAKQPEPTMVDVTKEAGLVGDDGEVLGSSRVSVADWNGDGWDDISAGSRFWENNQDGTFRKVDLGITASATTWGDYDNDGDLDCYAARGGENEDALWRNDGDGNFTNVTAESGLSNPRPTITPTWFDFDLDGDLDLFISNGRTGSSPNEIFYPDQLFINNGEGKFTNATEASGVAAGEPAPHYDAWGSTPGDYNNDGYTDIFVATYRLAPDLLFRNEGNGTMTEQGVATGVRGEETVNPIYFGHGIGAEFADYDNDGNLDLTVGNLGHPDWRGQVSNPSRIYHNEGAPNYTFKEVHKELGLKFFEMNAGVVWGDWDLDGYLDLFHCQYSYQKEGANGEPARLSRIYINGGPDEEWRLHDKTWQTGLTVHGTWTAARLDYDRDGDLDLVVASPRENMKLYQNNLPRKGEPISFRLRGAPSVGVPADGYGARVVVHHGEETYTRELAGGGSGATGSQNSNALHFGVGTRSDNSRVDSVVVTWGSIRHVFTDLETGWEYQILISSGEISKLHGTQLSVGRAEEIRTFGENMRTTRDGSNLRLELPIESEDRLFVEVVTSDGRVVLGEEHFFGGGRSTVLLLPDDLPAGPYLVRAEGKRVRFTGRFEVE